MKKITKFTLLATPLALIPVISLAASCGDKSDSGTPPFDGQIVDVTSATEGTFHGIFRNGNSPTLPVANVNFKVTVDNTVLTYIWIEADRSSAIPIAYLTGRAPYSHVLAYLSTKLAGTTKTPAAVYRAIVGNSSMHGINAFPNITI